MGLEVLPIKAFDQHQHLSIPRVADDKLLNARVDDVLIKEAALLAAAQIRVNMAAKTRSSAWP